MTSQYSIHEDDQNAGFKVRRNGKVFYIQISPLNDVVNSLTMTEKYSAYLEVLRFGEEVVGDIHETDAFEWITKP